MNTLYNTNTMMNEMTKVELLDAFTWIGVKPVSTMKTKKDAIALELLQNLVVRNYIEINVIYNYYYMESEDLVSYNANVVMTTDILAYDYSTGSFDLNDVVILEDCVSVLVETENQNKEKEVVSMTNKPVEIEVNKAVSTTEKVNPNVVKQVAFYQHKNTNKCYKWISSLLVGKTRVVTLENYEGKKYQISLENAKKFFVRVTEQVAYELMLKEKIQAAAPKEVFVPKTTPTNQSNYRSNPSTNPDLEVNVKRINGKDTWSVKYLRNGRVVNAVPGKTVTNMIHSYEVQIGKLKAQVTFTPDKAV